jgi:hypothetical protein
MPQATTADRGGKPTGPTQNRPTNPPWPYTTADFREAIRRGARGYTGRPYLTESVQETLRRATRNAAEYTRSHPDPNMYDPEGTPRDWPRGGRAGS